MANATPEAPLEGHRPENFMVAVISEEQQLESLVNHRDGVRQIIKLHGVDDIVLVGRHSIDLQR